MKLRQFRELREMAAGGLKKELATRRETLVKLTEELAGGKVKDVKAIRAIKKDIARILTLLREKATGGTALLREKKSV